MTFRPLQAFVEQLSAHTYLTDEERMVLLDLPTSIVHLPKDHVVVRQEEAVHSSCIVVSGLLARTCDVKEGGRQITSFYVAGEMPDLRTLMRPKATFGLCAVCPSEIARIPHAAMLMAMRSFAGISEAFARELVHESDRTSEWLINLGTRTAKERIAHLFCEIAVKTKTDKDTNTEYYFPVTQLVLADATGLSTVHVNRSIQSLRQQGVLSLEHGCVHVPDWKALVEVAGFDRGYLEPGRPMRRLSLGPLSNGSRTNGPDPEYLGPDL